MTKLKKPISRITNTELGGEYGPDHGRLIVVTLVPGKEDTIELRPQGTRRPEYIKITDVYRLAMMGRINRANLEKAREKKVQKQAKREAAKIERMRKKLTAK